MANFYPGVAGRRGYNPTHLVYHNDGGSQGATAAFYKGWLPNHEATLGFAHDYVASDGIYHAEDYENKAWHTANSIGNRDYVGIEICQSLGDAKTFLANEQKAFQLGAKVCKQFGWKVTTDLFPLHKELSSTDCPHRTWALHGKSVQAIRQYYCDQTKKYMDGVIETPKQKKKAGNVMLLFRPEGSAEVYFLIGNQYTHVKSETDLTTVKVMMTQAGFDTHIHTNLTQIKYLKKLAKEAK